MTLMEPIEPEAYLELAQDTCVKLYTRNSGTIEKEMEELERPGTRKLQDICQGSQPGRAHFEDRVRITADEEIEIIGGELYYSDVMVSKRRIPVIRMRKGEQLEITWEFDIERGSGEPDPLLKKLKRKLAKVNG